VWEKNFDELLSRFDTMSDCDRQTDRQTNDQTSCDSTVRVIILDLRGHNVIALKKTMLPT